ncbi:MAG: UvrD-helicase domain-containing protein [Eubacterium sp.]
MNLSPIQEEIVNTPGNLIVRASAGTGKTHTMVSKIAKEINENRTHKVVAAITFTIKAAQEIKDRLSVDVTRHFIGTNNSFVVEEIIKPFMKDVYGWDYDLEMSTDYSKEAKVDTFSEAIEKIKTEGVLCSYTDNKKNFIFELAQEIVEKSIACRLFLQAKYFKIYIDEYQDCDKSMHELFMYLCDTLKIETFVVGDEKQSIYIWRGAYPEAFVSIQGKSNFTSKFMGDNFRSCKQIQNYSNLLYDETSSLYSPTTELNNIIWLSTTSTAWASEVLKYIDPNKKSALLRFRNDNARLGAAKLSSHGVDYVYIPQIPIAEITTDTAWLYSAIAKYLIIEKYSAYDLISEIPIGGNETRKFVFTIKKMLKAIERSVDDESKFYSTAKALATYLGYVTKDEHLKKLFETVTDEKYHVAFESEKYRHIAITLHSSKGLEFEQVIVFAEDYHLSDVSGLCNHYVAVTRAKSKLIIVKLNNSDANCFQGNLVKIFAKSGVNINDVLIQKQTY